MAVHYLTGTGWTFSRWEPPTAPGTDVDVELRAPDGTLAQLQVKAPDQPGGRAGHLIVDGEHDDRVLSQVHKAAKQLPLDGSAAKIVTVSPIRDWSVSGRPGFLVRDLIGSTVEEGTVVFLPTSRLGCFFTTDWAHVGAVVVLDLVRGVDEARYGCTVLANPNAVVRVDPKWFSRGRVCWFDGEAFRWTPNPPGRAHKLPEGTRIVDDHQRSPKGMR